MIRASIKRNNENAMRQIQAAVCWEKGEKLKVSTVHLENILDNQVLVEILACAVSPFDAAQAKHGHKLNTFPMIPGHEAVGRVVQVGKDVHSVAVGDTVIPLSIPQCNQCKACLSDKTNLCHALRITRSQEFIPDYPPRLLADEQPLCSFMGIAGFSSHIAMPEIAVTKVTSSASPEELAIYCSAVVSGVGAVFQNSALTGQEQIAVLGANPTGLGVVQAARLKGIKDIIVIEASEKKRKVALQMGASIAFDPDALGRSLIPSIREVSKGGVDIAFECTAEQNAAALAIESTCEGWGETILVETHQPLHPSSWTLPRVCSGKSIRSCVFGGLQGRSDMQDYVALLESGEIEVKSMIDNVITLHEVNEYLNKAHHPDYLRSVICF